MQFGAFRHHRRHETLVFAAKLAERAGSLLEVQLPNGLQNLRFFWVFAPTPLGHKLLGVLVGKTHPVP